MQARLVILRVLCNGKTLAFQANDAGSIPATRFALKRASALKFTMSLA
jgi:hypothetical protein